MTRPHDSLGFRIAATVLLPILLIGFGLFQLVSRSLDRFAMAQLQSELQWVGGDAYSLCERAISDLAKSAALGDPLRTRITQGLTLGALEDLLRRTNIGGAVFRGTETEPLVDVALPLPPAAALGQSKGSGGLRVIQAGTRRYGSTLVAFEPWHWRILLLGDLDRHSGIVSEIRTVYAVAGVSLAVIAPLLIFALGRAIRRPLGAIIDPIRQGLPPAYRGVREFEFLSDTVRAMMTSEQDKSRMLAEAQRIAHLGNWIWDLKQNELHWSEELHRVTGIEELDPERLAAAFWSSIHPADLARFREEFRRTLKLGQALDTRLRILRPNGLERVLHTRAEVTRDLDGTTVLMSGIAHDVTTAVQAERALRSSEVRFRSMSENSQAGIWQMDRDGETLYANPAVCRMLGVADTAELCTRPWRSFFTPEAAARIDAEHEKRYSGNSSNYEAEIVDTHGNHRTVMVSGSPLLSADGAVEGSIGTFIDISDRKHAEAERQRLEEQIQQAQRLESLGVLAGGIAHDFNNTLTPIIGYAEMVLDEIPTDSPSYENMGRVITAAERARDLVNQILLFSRGDRDGAFLFHLEPVVQETAQLLRAILPASVELNVLLTPVQGVLRANPTQVHQVVMNLCTNAAHAMGARGGVLEVRLEPLSPADLGDAPGEEALPRAPAWGYACLTVQDTGHGIPPEIRERLFEPFFTTKPVGQGSGMGLAVVHGIVRQLGGWIELDSEVGHGARFQIILPLEAADATEQQAPTPALCQGGEERLLLVDDEEMLAELWLQALGKAGYEVEVTTSSEDALERFRNDPQHFDLVVTDQTMPRLPGDALARELLALRPDLPVILCTGFSHSITVESARSMGLRGFLQKPCSPSELRAAVRRVLDGEPFVGPQDA